jgi:hypothetical protein
MQRPWLDDSVSANGRSIQENFAQWFGASKAVSGDGAPLTLFHSTFSEFDAFEQTKDMGFHFGSPFAANKRIEEAAKGRGKGHKKFDGVNTVPVHLAIENPFHLESDPVAWNPEYLFTVLTGASQPERLQAIRQLNETCVASAREEADRLQKAGGRGLIRKKQPWSGGLVFVELQTRVWLSLLDKHQKPVNQALVSELKKQGFDGLTYFNEIEGEGRTKSLRSKNTSNLTWVAFDAHQIKSALCNSGLYLKNESSLTDVGAPRDLERIQRARLAQTVIEQPSTRRRHAAALA